jgi:hypothetical protein
VVHYLASHAGSGTAALDKDGAVIGFGAAAEEVEPDPDDEQKLVHHLALCRDGRHVVEVGGNPWLVVRDVVTMQVERAWAPERFVPSWTTHFVLDGSVTCPSRSGERVSFLAGRRGDGSGSILELHLLEGGTLRRLPAGADAVEALVLDDRYLIVGRKGAVQAHDVRTGAALDVEVPDIAALDVLQDPDIGVWDAQLDATGSTVAVLVAGEPRTPLPDGVTVPVLLVGPVAGPLAELRPAHTSYVLPQMQPLGPGFLVESDLSGPSARGFPWRQSDSVEVGPDGTITPSQQPPMGFREWIRLPEPVTLDPAAPRTLPEGTIPPTSSKPTSYPVVVVGAVLVLVGIRKVVAAAGASPLAALSRGGARPPGTPDRGSGDR